MLRTSCGLSKIMRTECGLPGTKAKAWGTYRLGIELDAPGLTELALEIAGQGSTALDEGLRGSRGLEAQPGWIGVEGGLVVRRPARQGRGQI